MHHTAGAWRRGECLLSKKQCETCCDDAKRCGEQSGDDGTDDQRVREIREHEIPEFLKIGIVIRQAEEGPMRTHLFNELAQVGNIPDKR